MITYLNTPIFGVALTILVFSIFQVLNKKTKLTILNPIILSIIAIIYFLNYFKIDYEVYSQGGSIISFFLGPATVVLAIPLYKKVKLLIENFLPIAIGIFVGSLTGAVSVILISKAFKIDKLIILSMIPKSTTSAIAMDLSQSLGGSPALAISFVILTGILGNIIGPSIFKIFKINNRVAKGIALGTSAHVVGTAKAVELGDVEGGMSSLAIGVAGLITVFLAPFILTLIEL